MGYFVLFQWKRGLTVQLNMSRSLPQQQKQQWGSPVAEAALQANVVEADAVDSVITTEGESSLTADRETTTTTTGQRELLHMDASMALAALVATMVEAGAMESALALFAALPGIKPSTALKRVKASVPLPKEMCRVKSHVSL